MSKVIIVIRMKVSHDVARLTLVKEVCNWTHACVSNPSTPETIAEPWVRHCFQEEHLATWSDYVGRQWFILTATNTNIYYIWTWLPHPHVSDNITFYRHKNALFSIMESHTTLLLTKEHIVQTRSRKMDSQLCLIMNFITQKQSNRQNIGLTHYRLG